jgi:Rhodopirellula transposase DDE domain
MANAELLKAIGPGLGLLLPELDEKARRLTLGAVALAAGDGGIGAVAKMTGASWQTVANGAAELESGQVAPEGRVRRPGAGRRPLAEVDPGLRPALLALVEDSSRGDPESPLLWTTRSAAHLAGELRAQGHRCSPQTAWRLLRDEGFSTQANAKVAEGRRHPDRDAQFRYLAGQAREHLAAGQPVISVDAKKKEQVGEFAQAGREWRPKGDPVKVRDHCFADRDGGHAIPYGVYDVAANTGFVNVGTDGNTAALAVESIRRWWALAGRDAYPDAARLLVSCDAGGSNGWRNRGWKAGLAELAQETGLEITVCHFPPGTSKWNKIEHRLFSQITLGWRGRPLTSYDVIINTISAVTTRTGLRVTAMLDDSPCPTGTRISDQQVKDIEERHLTRHEFHGEWNYTVLPVPRPAPEPEPEPEPARPGRAAAGLLNHPALTGLDPADLTALAAALAVPFRARREQRRYLRHGRARQLAEGATGGGSNRKLDLTDHLLATRMRQHLNLSPTVTGALLGAHGTTISHATTLTTSLLAGQPQPPAAPPPGIRLRTLADLREYAAGHGITIPAGIGGHTPPADSTLQAPDTPQTQLNLECLPSDNDAPSWRLLPRAERRIWLRGRRAGRMGHAGKAHRASFPAEDEACGSFPGRR